VIEQFMIRRRARTLVLVGLLAVSACGGDETTTQPTGPLGTVAGVGVVPDPSGSGSLSGTGGNTTVASGRQLTVGEVADGNRVLFIGDSIFAALSRRFNGIACDLLVPLGWQVSVEGERGKPINLGLDIIDKKLPQGFDAAVLFLGTNYGRDQAKYREMLRQILDTLAPRPVIILTATEYKPFITEVNDVILEEAQARDNLWLLDWRSISRSPGLLWKDGIHPVAAGNEVLMARIIELLGAAPTPATGKCLPSEFTDDAPLRNLPPESSTTTVVDPMSTTTTDPTASTTTSIAANTSSTSSTSPTSSTMVSPPG
jgi:hypothetical protein